MQVGYETIRLDVFSLAWIGDNPAASRSAGIMSVTYNTALDQELMKETIVTLLENYPFFCGNLALIGEDYHLRVPKQVDEEEIRSRITITSKSQEEIFQKLSKKELNLFRDKLYQIYLLNHDTSFDIVIYGSHLLGDGLTSATGMSILTYNYHLASKGRKKEQIYPPVEYKQLLQYGYRMWRTRSGILWVPRLLRFIPGYLYYRRKSKLDVPDQVFNEPVPLDEPLIRDKINLGTDFVKLLGSLKEQFDINSNHLITALISYSLLETQDYEKTVCTYPINIRNSYGFEAGNLITVNRIEIQYKRTFIDFLVHIRDILEREKNSSGPYYAISMGKFVKTDYEAVSDRLNKVVRKSNLRISNVGRLPAPNLNMIKTDIYEQIPLSHYYANALPLASIGVHFFISSVANNFVNDYYITILHSEKSSEVVNNIIAYLTQKIKEQSHIYTK